MDQSSHSAEGRLIFFILSDRVTDSTILVSICSLTPCNTTAMPMGFLSSVPVFEWETNGRTPSSGGWCHPRPLPYTIPPSSSFHSENAYCQPVVEEHQPASFTVLRPSTNWPSAGAPYTERLWHQALAVCKFCQQWRAQNWALSGEH